MNRGTSFGKPSIGIGTVFIVTLVVAGIVLTICSYFEIGMF